MRWLVLGASGFIGRNLLRQLRANAWEAIGTGHHHLDADLREFDLERDSITNVVDSSWFQRNDVVAVHCIAHANIDQCLLDKDRSRRLGVDATIRTIEELTALNARQVYLSTNYVFEGLRGGYREDDPCHPVNEYGRQKLAVEQFLTRSIPSALVLRLDKVIGTSLTEDHVLSQWWRSAQNGQPLRCLINQTFTPVSVDEVARSVIALVEAGKSGIYHVAGPEPINRTQMARNFCKACGIHPPIVELTAAEMNLVDARPPNASLEINKLCGELSFTPSRPAAIIDQFARKL